ncbi:MAG: pyridoxal 5'-phosphate synthase glutaminase subunit PdxT [Alphaproteobacteria bacterium]|nr:pyridoxal 5'-phosphate synthase glutaminase subunit PdxT [Alphaproteobacteria bacterium]MCD8526074.1 pyridoxal 5'-phosphate synthase glutaminase subunit PdxT [Alphaproteobacteria bacterium]MCD8570960.1 pyridoxal 5'-phosphate synthase glutaminase subunit PdxT [Alphaproteobacteria bacterium]
MSEKPIIGVLSLQGAVELHKPHIEAAGAEYRAVKTPAQFDAVDGFILPGGESTTMLKLIEVFGLWDSLAKNLSTKPVWGICAGAILLAEKVTSPAQKSFGLLPLTVERNGYGSQIDSHIEEIEGYEVSFIRAPVFKDVGKGTEILAEHRGLPVWIKKGKIMASSFHPELTLDFPSPMHRMFVESVKAIKKAA